MLASLGVWAAAMNLNLEKTWFICCLFVLSCSFAQAAGFSVQEAFEMPPVTERGCTLQALA